MNELSPPQYKCTAGCDYRGSEQMCILGRKRVPHPKIGHQCLYPATMSRYLPQPEMNFKTVAAIKWTQENDSLIDMPPGLHKMIRIVTANLS